MDTTAAGPRDFEEGRTRGREATRPRELGKKGWRDVLLRVKSELSDDQVGIVAAGVAFYALLAVFPAITAMVSIYGLIADPADVGQILAQMKGALPGEAYDVLAGQLHQVAAGSGTALGFGVVAGILLSIWSANAGIKALMSALDIVYDQKETRGFFKLNGTSLLITFGAIVVALLAVGMVIATPVVLEALSLGGIAETLISLLRWPVLLIVFMTGLSVIYRLGPDRRNAQWRWITPGAVLATVLWLVGSIAFSFYVSNFGSYNKTYGSLGAVVVLLMWFWLTAFVVLIGAELNAEMEHQTRRDTTEGHEKPLGRRGANMADTVGETP